jgi:hypothetical protein
MDADIDRKIRMQAEECTENIRRRWLYFIDTLKFKPEVTLTEVIESFAMPIQEYVEAHYPLLIASSPELFWMMIFRAIQIASTHPQADLNVATEELYQKLRTR